MNQMRHLFVPHWPRFIPGFLFCLVFAFLGMNLDHLVGNYHKANMASIKLPVLEQQLAEMAASGADSQTLATVQGDIDKQLKALDKVGGTVGQRWAWATFLHEEAQFTYVAILLLGGILIRNLVPLPKVLFPGISIARPVIKPGIIILGVHYVWADVIRVGGMGLALVVVLLIGTELLRVTGGG